MIFATNFDNETKIAHGPSTDSGFSDLNHVISIMGNDYKFKTKRLVIYGTGKDRTVFSDFRFL